MEKQRSSIMIWLSGFFGLGGLVHLFRFALGVDLAVAGHEIPLIGSGIGGLILGLLAVLCWAQSSKGGCRKSSEAQGAEPESGGGSCCGH